MELIIYLVEEDGLRLRPQEKFERQTTTSQAWDRNQRVNNDAGGWDRNLLAGRQDGGGGRYPDKGRAAAAVAARDGRTAAGRSSKSLKHFQVNCVLFKLQGFFRLKATSTGYLVCPYVYQTDLTSAITPSVERSLEQFISFV